MIHRTQKTVYIATFFVGTLIAGERAYQVIRYNKEQHKAVIKESIEHAPAINAESRK